MTFFSRAVCTVQYKPLFPYRYRCHTLVVSVTTLSDPRGTDSRLSDWLPFSKKKKWHRINIAAVSEGDCRETAIVLIIMVLWSHIEDKFDILYDNLTFFCLHLYSIPFITSGFLFSLFNIMGDPISIQFYSLHYIYGLQSAQIH